ncbi:N-acetylglucosamine-6-phosphate deacetylase [Gracilibacillus salitolerans]|uniref:N-acetylglucosamine-6-phosphate deacetylase n=1 Tax=Gracilibacillus salitolerans TaxID=2663022 RepID=A0A5Q2THL8_9BACI|nr:N-acetylglucosamine-6-phosphate deacetylase [Gracilibacillus salitolerans]QGH33641.1 N-acetylglucosamine-6-phosphate deacetylase [Gracilibacillus salitolerans]
MAKQRIIHANIVLEKEIWKNGSVLIDNGTIIEVSDNNDVSENVTIIDAKNKLLIPGMVDVHIHGANGFDMMDGTTESVQEVSKQCAKTGCTSFLATSVTSSLDALEEMIDSVKKVKGQEQGASIAGIHLEGPYLNEKRKGMQNQKYLREPNVSEIDKLLVRAESFIKMVTVAPELDGGLELVKYLVEKEVIVAIAHSDATYEEAKEAFQHGASHVTHCFNAMSPIHHRKPGVVTAAFEQEHVSLQAIVDNVHLHPAIVRLMHRIKGSEKLVLITDALQAMGLGDGQYHFGGHHVTVKDGIATLSDGTLASSTVTMNQALKKTFENGVPLVDAVRMAATTPAELLGLMRKGKIAEGYDADLVLLDEDFHVSKTMKEGHIISL